MVTAAVLLTGPPSAQWEDTWSAVAIRMLLCVGLCLCPGALSLQYSASSASEKQPVPRADPDAIDVVGIAVAKSSREQVNSRSMKARCVESRTTRPRSSACRCLFIALSCISHNPSGARMSNSTFNEPIFPVVGYDLIPVSRFEMIVLRMHYLGNATQELSAEIGPFHGMTATVARALAEDLQKHAALLEATCAWSAPGMAP